MKRCYFDGIPDEVIIGLEKTGRVPSYKAIAKCILNNDLMLRNIGFSEDEGLLAKILRKEKNKTKTKQLDLF